MDHIEAEQHRDTEPMTFDREPLKAIDLPRIGDEQQRPRTTLPQSRLDHLRLPQESRLQVGSGWQAQVEVLAQLPSLLGRRHLGDQLLDPRPDRLLIGHVERSSRGLMASCQTAPSTGLPLRPQYRSPRHVHHDPRAH